MKKKMSVGLSVLLICLAAIIAFQLTFVLMSQKHQKELAAVTAHVAQYDKLLEVDALFRSLYVEDLDEAALMDGILTGYVYGTGDKYAAYYPAEEFAQYMESLQGDMQGVGIHII